MRRWPRVVGALIILAALAYGFFVYIDSPGLREDGAPSLSQTEVAPGETLLITRHLCAHRQVDLVQVRTLVSASGEPHPIGGIPLTVRKGCHAYDIPATVPPIIPPGPWTYRARAVFRVNPIKDALEDSALELRPLSLTILPPVTPTGVDAPIITKHARDDSEKFRGLERRIEALERRLSR